MKKNKKNRWLLFAGFAAYLVLLLYLTMFAEMLGRTGEHRGYTYNLEPFREIRRFIRYAHVLGFPAVFMNLAGNVLAFMPLGFMTPVLWKRMRSFWLVALISLAASLCIETVQLAFQVGSFDVDDIILNTIGGMLGYGACRLFLRGGD